LEECGLWHRFFRDCREKRPVKCRSRDLASNLGRAEILVWRSVASGTDFPGTVEKRGW